MLSGDLTTTPKAVALNPRSPCHRITRSLCRQETRRQDSRRTILREVVSHKFNELVNPLTAANTALSSSVPVLWRCCAIPEQGYNVSCFCYQDSPCRAPALPQGDNAAKIIRTMATASIVSSTTPSSAATTVLAKRTSIARRSAPISSIKVYRVFPLREYGGPSPTVPLAAQVSAPYARGQTGQLLLGAYSALSKQIGLGGHVQLPRNARPRPYRWSRQRYCGA